MFESILIRQLSSIQAPIDPGLLAEALLFYRQVTVAATRGDLIALLKTIGPDDLIGLIEDKHLSLTFYEDVLATHTDTRNGIPEHQYISFQVTGDRKKKKWTRQDTIDFLVGEALGKSGHSKRIARKLLELMPHRKINITTGGMPSVTDAALEDLGDFRYVHDAVYRILESYVPKYARTHKLEFDIVKLGNKFYATHNIDLATASKEFNANFPNYVGSLTTPFIVDHLLDVRGEMLLSCEYMSELVTTPTLNSLMELQFGHLLQKAKRNREQIKMFQDTVLDGRSLREVINSGERSFEEFRKLLDKAARFKTFLAGINPDQNALAEYIKNANATGWLGSLPSKIVRFSICTGAGLLAPIAGAVLSGADTLLLDKVSQGWRPHHFVQGPLAKFVEA